MSINRCHELDDQPALAAHIPSRLLDGLRRYALDGVPTGSFLRAVLENDLRLAVFSGDAESLAALPDIVRYVHQCLPAPCHGSAAAVERWCVRSHQFRDVPLDSHERRRA